jgi:RNA polymerase sigma-70 factor (ECF subfamily)
MLFAASTPTMTSIECRIAKRWFPTVGMNVAFPKTPARRRVRRAPDSFVFRGSGAIEILKSWEGNIMVTAETLKTVGRMSLRAGDDSPSDEDLFLDYRLTGNQASFERLVHRHERPLYRYLRRYLGSAEMAEDVFQRTFLQVHLKRDSFEPGRPVRPWIYRIATNQAIDALRRARRHRLASLDYVSANSARNGTLGDSLPAPGAPPISAMVRRENADWSRSAVAALPQRLRAVVELVYFGGVTYREAGERLSLPLGTIKSRISAALKQLREAWDESGTSEFDSSPVGLRAAVA